MSNKYYQICYEIYFYLICSFIFFIIALILNHRDFFGFIHFLFFLCSWCCDSFCFSFSVQVSLDKPIHLIHVCCSGLRSNFSLIFIQSSLHFFVSWFYMFHCLTLSPFLFPFSSVFFQFRPFSAMCFFFSFHFSPVSYVLFPLCLFFVCVFTYVPMSIFLFWSFSSINERIM